MVVHRKKSSFLVSQGLFIGNYSSDNRIQELFTLFQNQSQGKRGSLLVTITSLHSVSNDNLYKPFPWYYGTLLGIATPLEHFSDISLDILGISCFKVTLCL